MRPEHRRRVITTARAWGDFWRLTPGPKQAWRNQVLLDRGEHDYSFLDWLYGPTALTPRRNPAMFTPIWYDEVAART